MIKKVYLNIAYHIINSGGSVDAVKTNKFLCSKLKDNEMAQLLAMVQSSLKPKHNKLIYPVRFRIDSILKSKIDYYTNKQKLTRSFFLRKIISDFLNK